MTHRRTRSEKKLAEQGHYEEYAKKGGSVKAKERFERKPYYTRGEAIGQKNSK